MSELDDLRAENERLRERVTELEGFAIEGDRAALIILVKNREAERDAADARAQEAKTRIETALEALDDLTLGCSGQRIDHVRDVLTAALTDTRAPKGEEEDKPVGSREAAGRLLELAYDYWKTYQRDTGGAAVVWVRDANGAQVVYTRGEHDSDLMRGVVAAFPGTEGPFYFDQQDDPDRCAALTDIPASKQIDRETLKQAAVERLGPYDPCLPMQWATLGAVVDLMEWAAKPPSGEGDG